MAPVLCVAPPSLSIPSQGGAAESAGLWRGRHVGSQCRRQLAVGAAVALCAGAILSSETSGAVAVIGAPRPQAFARVMPGISERRTGRMGVAPIRVRQWVRARAARLPPGTLCGRSVPHGARHALMGQTDNGVEVQPHERRPVAGFFIIVLWQAIGINLYRLLSFMADSETTFGALQVAVVGMLLFLLRYWPPAFVRPRQEAWQALVAAWITRGCPAWYKDHASQTIAKWIDGSLTVLQNSLALELILRGLPQFLNLCTLWIPSLQNKPFLDAKSRIVVCKVVADVTERLLFVAVTILFGKMLLSLKSENSKAPSTQKEALNGAAGPWRFAVQFVAAKGRAVKLRSSGMRLLLLDKIFTCAIYCGMAVPVLHLLHLKVRTVLAVGGVGGLATGLALQNMVQNLISGILIFINASVCEGLEVVLQTDKDNVSGVVASVGWFSTVVNQYDGMRVVVPNRRIVDGIVIDKTNKRFRRVDEDVLVRMDDAARFEALIAGVREMLRENPVVLQEHSVEKIRRANKGHIKLYTPQFVFEGWSEYGAKCRVRAYFKARLSSDVFMEEKSKLLMEVNSKIREFGGTVGFPGYLPKATAVAAAEPMSQESTTNIGVVLSRHSDSGQEDGCET